MRVFALGLLIVACARSGVVDEVRFAIAAGNFGMAEERLTATRRNAPAVEWLDANSWLARGLLEAGRPAEADKLAVQTRVDIVALLARRKLDAEPELPLALGAAIEVHALALSRQGQRSEAVAFLRGELVKWRGSSIEARIHKNLNLLSLEGKPAPPIDVTHWVGPVRPLSLHAMRGHPVLLFFWAHWCVDCKADIPIIQQLLAKFGPAGLKLMGPTMHYGFAGGGEEASPEKETAWIEAIREKYYARIGPMPAPVSENTLRLYGVSTTPTLVLVDKQGIVRMYHPGAMNYDELAFAVSKVM